MCHNGEKMSKYVYRVHICHQHEGMFCPEIASPILTCIEGEALANRGKLLSKAVSEAMSRGAAKRAIAVKSGYLDRKPQEIVRAPRKQVYPILVACAKPFRSSCKVVAGSHVKALFFQTVQQSIMSRRCPQDCVYQHSNYRFVFGELHYSCLQARCQ